MKDSLSEVALLPALVDRCRGEGSTIAAGEALAESLATRLAESWSAGRKVPAETLLAQHPALAGSPTAAARVVYEEYCQREALGDPPSAHELFQRFPQWRTELARLLDCHRALRGPGVPTGLPEVGESIGDFDLRAVLGRGLRGRVYLATQRSLADRPIALKLSTGRCGEHLTLARVQHAHIVPLYAFHEFPERNIRALCMPYLGGLTVDRVLSRLEARPEPPAGGRVLLQLLDEARTEYVAVPAWSAARQFLAVTSYARGFCWIAACLADALHYAHERGLVHLDIKPSNILLADDGQPMLLDFHLARGPIAADADVQGHLGGTPGYMSPEQAAGVTAARNGGRVPASIGRTSDIYSLGAVLLEALTGLLPPPAALGAGTADMARALRFGLNGRRLDGELARVVARCLATDPAERFPDAAALADALRRHVGHLPLHGNPRPGRLRRWLRSWRDSIG